MATTSTPAPRSGLVIGICFLIAAIEGYDIQAFGVAAPRLASEIGVGPAQLGWAATAAMLGLMLGAVTGGWAADRWGRKPVLLVSVLAFGLFSGVTALAHSEAALLAARFATGLGFGGAMPNLIAIAGEISGPKRRAAVTSAMFCGMPAGGSAVALLAMATGDTLPWRALFLLGGALPLLLAPAIAALLPETRPERAPDEDRRLGWALFAQGRAGPTLLFWAANLLTLVIVYLLLNWLPALVVAKGHSVANGAAASLAFNLAGAVGALAIGVTVDKVGVGRAAPLAYASLAAAMAGLAAAGALPWILAGSALAGFMVLGAQYALYGLAPALYPAHARAAGAGAGVAVGRMGSVIGPLLAGQLRQAGWTADQVLGAMLPVALAAGLAILVLARTPALRQG